MVGPAATRPSRAKGRVFPLEGLQGESKEAPRTASGIAGATASPAAASCAAR